MCMVQQLFNVFKKPLLQFADCNQQANVTDANGVISIWRLTKPNAWEQFFFTNSSAQTHHWPIKSCYHSKQIKISLTHHSGFQYHTLLLIGQFVSSIPIAFKKLLPFCTSAISVTIALLAIHIEIYWKQSTRCMLSQSSTSSTSKHRLTFTTRFMWCSSSTTYPN